MTTTINKEELTVKITTLLSAWQILTLIVLVIGVLINVALITIGAPVWISFLTGFVIFYVFGLFRGPITRAFVTNGL